MILSHLLSGHLRKKMIGINSKEVFCRDVLGCARYTAQNGFCGQYSTHAVLVFNASLKYASRTDLAVWAPLPKEAK
jgi:hypothetical protein